MRARVGSRAAARAEVVQKPQSPSKIRVGSATCTGYGGRRLAPSVRPRHDAAMAPLSYASGTSTTPLLGETIGDNLARIVERSGDRDALVVRHQDVRWTYRELDERVDDVARGLLAAGIEKGDRVGIWAPNCAE